jgi:predicted nucleic acid-binding protein
MYVYVYVRVCVHTHYIYIYIHIYTYIYIHTYIHIYTHNIMIFTYIYIYMYIIIYISISIYIYYNIHKYIHIHSTSCSGRRSTGSKAISAARERALAERGLRALLRKPQRGVLRLADEHRADAALGARDRLAIAHARHIGKKERSLCMIARTSG